MFLTAEPSGKMPALAYALSRARWMHGKNICDHDTVVEVASSPRLNSPEPTGAEADPTIRESGTRMLLATPRDGVFAILRKRACPLLGSRATRYLRIRSEMQRGHPH